MALLGRADALSAAFDTLRLRDAAAYEAAERAASAHPGFVAEISVSLPMPLDGPIAEAFHEPLPSLVAAAQPVPAAVPATPAPSFAAPPTERSTSIDWSRFTRAGGAAQPRSVSGMVGAALRSMSTAAVRVRAALLDRLVNQAGEVSITRARLETDVDADARRARTT